MSLDENGRIKSAGLSEQKVSVKGVVLHTSQDGHAARFFPDGKFKSMFLSSASVFANKIKIQDYQIRAHGKLEFYSDESIKMAEIIGCHKLKTESGQMETFCDQRLRFTEDELVKRGDD